MARDLLAKVRSTAAYAKMRMGQSRVPYLPEERLHEMRDKRLQQIVRYAAETVPYYRDLFRAEGINPADIRTVDDLDRLPLIDKQQVAHHPKRFVSTSRWGRTARPAVTSGSTGMPLKVYHDRHSLLLASAVALRERDARTRGFGLSPTSRFAAITLPGRAWVVAPIAKPHTRFSLFRQNGLSLSVLQPLEEVIAAINQLRPEMIVGYGSYLTALFMTVALGGTYLHMPKLVVYYGDALTDAGRHVIRDELGIAVMSVYGAAEAFKIGFSCEQGSGHHLHADLTHVKIVDRNGQRMPRGERGEVVISNLVNRGTVLLNYRLGDIAALSDRRCPCGRTLPLLASLEGRVEDVIYLRNGRFVYPGAVRDVMKHLEGVLQYQLIQLEADVFELKLATVDPDTFERVSGELLTALRRLLGDSACIEPVYHDERLEPGPSGKFRPILSLPKDKVLPQ
jgi:phenylacetate-CoA ligase